MKRIIAPLLTVIICLCLAACREHYHNSSRKKLTRCEKLQQKAVRNGIGSNR